MILKLDMQGLKYAENVGNSKFVTQQKAFLFFEHNGWQ